MANIFSLLIGCIVSFLPLYTRFSTVNLDRVSKAFLLLLIIPFLQIVPFKKIRSVQNEIKFIFAACIFHMALFQFDPSSFSGIFGSIAIALWMIFFIKYHEHYTSEVIILNSLVIGSAIQCVISFSQYAGHDIYSSAMLLLNGDVKLVSMEENHFGSFANSNLFGAYLALCFPAFFRPKFIYFAPIILLFVFLSKSLMAIAACAAAITLYAKKNREKELYILAPIVFFTIILSISGLTSGRLDLWSTLVIKVDVMHFLFGMSPSWFDSLGLNISKNLVNNEHNEFFSAFNIFGIFGLLSCIFMHKLCIENKGKNILFGCITFAGFVNMLGNFPLHYAPLAIIIIISLAHCIKGNYVSNMDR